MTAWRISAASPGWRSAMGGWAISGAILAALLAGVFCDQPGHGFDIAMLLSAMAAGFLTVWGMDRLRRDAFLDGQAALLADQERRMAPIMAHLGRLRVLRPFLNHPDDGTD